MKSSPKKIAANQKNAQLSTGPKTEEGKAQSRLNALKHGLCSSVVIAEDAEAVHKRSNQFFNAFKPQNHLHCWYVTEISLISLRIDRAERMQRRARDKISIRAELCWDSERKLEASLLGEQLGNRPEVVVEKLMQTLHGCEWLMGRWAMLAHIADVHGTWTPSQESLAFDLMATPPQMRPGNKPGADIDDDGRVIVELTDPAAIARREIDALKERREYARTLDEVNRSLAIADLYDDTDQELKRLHRYENSLHRRFQWLVNQIRVQSPLHQPLSGLWRYWLGDGADPEIPLPNYPVLPPPISMPLPKAEVKITAGRFINAHPPFDLEPHEAPKPGETVDIPKILANRREEKLKKAETRREAKRRKIDKHRA